ncbi:PREDICTED: galectin-12 [Gekko japonicus]|uniref:Galectin n=1 Tax=Gekko japonicus TaxID=146911 RepID=A0ABM1KPW8_GEKJA|nr:PREDICTED: galectin-12 [Gekko japonicus]
MESSTDTADYILQAPVFHPVLPYITTIFGSLAPGRMVLLQGTVLMEAARFQVDFQTGCSLSPRADIAIHFNPRFRPQPHVICNALSNGRWMEEAKFFKLPLKRGDSFQLLFLFEQEYVKVSVNGLHFLQYRFNVPLVQMNTLGVSGGIFVKTIAFLASNPFDSVRKGYPLAPLLHLNNPGLTVPLTRQLPQALRPGDVIAVRGLVRQDPKEFHLSLKKDPSHVILRFSVYFVDQTVIWKSSADQRQNSGEKLVTCFPFYPQRYFELLLHCEKDHLKLALNGAPLGQRRFPLPSAEPITELAVEGDVTLYSILC